MGKQIRSWQAAITSSHDAARQEAKGSAQATVPGAHTEIVIQITYNGLTVLEERIAFLIRVPLGCDKLDQQSRQHVWVGYNHCGFDYSLDGGSHFGDGIPPFFQHTNPGTGHTYDAASDPAVTVTGAGRAWYSCVVFDINSNASAVFATRSTPALKGSAYANIPDAPSPLVVAETNDGHTFYDKEFIAGDTRPGHEEIYETLTVFLADQKCSKGNNPGAYCSSEIFYSKWDPAAGKFTPIANVSGSSSSLCVLGDFYDKKADPNACNFGLGSLLTTKEFYGGSSVFTPLLILSLKFDHLLFGLAAPGFYAHQLVSWQIERKPIPEQPMGRSDGKRLNRKPPELAERRW